MKNNLVLVAVLVAFLASCWASFVCGATAPSLTPLDPFEKSSGNSTGFLIISPDGRHVYAIGTLEETSVNNSISQFSRDESTGELFPLTPFTVPFASEVVTSGVFESSGEFLYLAPWNSNVTIYSRNTTTGQLTLVGTAPINSSATLSEYLLWSGLTISSDDTTLYHSSVELLTVLSRNPDGTLQTIQELDVPHVLTNSALGPDEKFLYVVAFSSSSSVADTVVYQFEVLPNKTVTLLTTFPGDNLTLSLAFSPDGKNLYIAASGLDDYDESGLLEYSVNPTTGALTLNNEYPACAETFKVVVSPEGQSVYVVCNGNNSIGQYFRDTDSGALSQLTPFLVPAGSSPFMGLEFSPDGRFLYVANSDMDNAGAGTIGGYSRFVPLSMSPSIFLPSNSNSNKPNYPTTSASPFPPPPSSSPPPPPPPPPASGTTGTTTATTGKRTTGERTTGKKRRSTTGRRPSRTTGVSHAGKISDAFLSSVLAIVLTFLAVVLF